MSAPSYGSKWRRFRESFLQGHPLCARCEAMGKSVAATVVHHQEPHRGDWAKFWAGPFEALCAPCHDRAGQLEDLGKVDPACGADGWPVSPRHPWNAGRVN